MSFWRFRASTAAGAVMLAALPGLVAGCQAASAEPATAAPEKTSIVVETPPTIDSAGLFIAQMKGLFRQQGLNVTIRFTPASQLAVSSLLNGTSDISSGDYVTYIRDELNGGARLSIIAEASCLQPNDLELLASPQSPVRSLSGLEGRTIGVTAPDDISTLLVRALLAENSVRTDRVNIRFGFQLLNLARQLDGGEADAAPVPEPLASAGEQRYSLRELADVDQGVTENFPLEGYAVTQAWARQNPGTVAAFTRALDQGQEIADTDRATAEAAIEKFLGLDARTAAVMALPSYPLSVNPTQLQRVVNVMVQFGLLPQRDASYRITAMTG